MSDRRRMFVNISVLLLLQNGLLAIVAIHLSPGLDTAMTAGLAAGVIALSMTTAMMATRIARDPARKSEVSPQRTVKVPVRPAPMSAPATVASGGHLDRSIKPTVSVISSKSAQGEIGTQQNIELALRMLDAGLRRLAVGDLSVRLEAPFPERYEGLRADFNRAVAMLDEGLSSITASASILHLECAEARLHLVQGKAETFGKAPEFATIRKGLAESDAALLGQATIIDEAAVRTSNASIRLRTARQAVEAASRSGQQGLQGVDERIRSTAALMRDVAFKTNMLSVNANIEAAKEVQPGHALRNFSVELRHLAEEAADAAKKASILERDMVLALAATVSSIDTFVLESRELENLLENAGTRLSSAAEKNGAARAQLQHSTAAIDQLSRYASEQRSIDKTVEAVLESMARELSTINHSCGSFIPVTVLHEGGTPPDGPPSRPRSHLRLVKS